MINYNEKYRLFEYYNMGICLICPTMLELQRQVQIIYNINILTILN
jgi:hypothetical protein